MVCLRGEVRFGGGVVCLRGEVRFGGGVLLSASESFLLTPGDKLRLSNNTVKAFSMCSSQ